MSRPPTLATVAAALGVTPMTVSNAYNRPEKLSAELRERILATAEELGYAGPNALARSLRRGRTGALGVVLGEALPYAFEDPGAVAFLGGLARAGADAGIALHLVPARGGVGDPALVQDAAVDAFVIFALPDGHPLVEAILRRGLPVVAQSGPELLGHPLVAIDERAAARAAAEHLLALGHRRVGILSIPLEDRERADRPLALATTPTHRVTRGRLAGYRDVLPGAPGREVAFNDRAHGEAAADVLLDGDDAPTALLCMSDELAIGALRAARRRGVELAVVGFDDTPEAARAGLTTIRQSLDEQGRVCGELAAAERPEPGVRLQPWQLVIRTTSRKLA